MKNTALLMTIWAWFAPLCQAQEAGSSVTCRLLAPDHKTIPIVIEYESWRTNIRIPPVVLENQTVSSVDLKIVEVIGRHGGKECARYTFHREDVGSILGVTNEILNQLTRGASNQWKTYNLKKMFGNVSLSDREFSSAFPLESREQTCINMHDLGCFQYDGPYRVEELALVFTLGIDGRDELVRFDVPLTHYECTGDYIFPITGGATVQAMPLGDGHRTLPSSEFAIDIISCRYLQDGKLSSSSPDSSRDVRDYFIFHRSVLAVGDGVVTSVGRAWPDSWTKNPLDYSIERIGDLTDTLIKTGAEFQNAYLGNYIIIDHGNGEFSAYVHLSEEGISVVKGDTVRQGQVIGRVGNSGNSTEPHLHFQLMDSPDYPSANGLPMKFRNLAEPLRYGNDTEYSSTLTNSDYLYIQTD